MESQYLKSLHSHLPTSPISTRPLLLAQPQTSRYLSKSRIQHLELPVAGHYSVACSAEVEDQDYPRPNWRGIVERDRGLSPQIERHLRVFEEGRSGFARMMTGLEREVEMEVVLGLELADSVLLEPVLFGSDDRQLLSCAGL